jgi:hypothetical protein
VTNAANGDVAYTGIGFVPTSIIFRSMAISGANVDGFVDSAKGMRRLFMMMDNAGTGAIIVETSTTDCLGITSVGDGNVTPDSTGQTAVLKTFDSDGFTLTWTKHGSPSPATVTIIALCYK